MSKPSEELEALFQEVVALESDAQRVAYLDRVCPNLALRREVELLLAAHQHPDSVFEEKTVPGNATPSEAVGTVIGRYKLLEALGEGGFGSVWLAEQKEPVRRKVALKVIKLGLETKQVVARFEAERQALALMDHPNVAKILDAGTTDTGRPYFVMELVRGIPITKFCDETKLTPHERLELFIKVCQAVQHAHQKGIIHRDLKPSNVLVTLHDGVPVPKVIDFGIAKATQHELTDKTLHTMFQQFMGTPAYVSPEQAEMSGLDIDTRSDIYSLGVLLYELLTGITPFDGRELLASGLDDMRRTIREKEPARPSTRLNQLSGEERTTAAHRRAMEPAKLIHFLQGDLDWIVMKCLEKDRTRRYETANGLATDIQRHLRHEPVGARPPSTVYRAQRFVRRNKVMVTAMGTVALALILGILMSTWQAVRATRAKKQANLARQLALQAQQSEVTQRQEAEAARNEAQQARQDAVHNLYIANLNLAQQDYEQGNLDRVRELLRETRHDPNRGFEWYYWQRELHRPQKTFRGHLAPVLGIAISPDEELIATASRDGRVMLWDTSGRKVRTFPFKESCLSVSFSPDGERLAIGSGPTIVIRDLRQDRELLVITNSYQAEVRMVAFSPDGNNIAAALWNVPGVAGILVHAATGKILNNFGNGTTSRTLYIGYSRDGHRILTGDYEGIARIWDAQSGALLRRFEGRGGSIWGGDFSPDGQRVVTTHDAAFVAKVWDVATTNVVHTLRGHRNFVEAAVFSPQGDRIYTTGLDQQIRVWDAASGRELPSLAKSQSSSIMRMIVSKDGRHILTGSWNGEANWWSVEAGGALTIPFTLWPQDDYSIPARWDGHAHGPIVGLASDDEHGLVAAAGPDYAVRVRELGSDRNLFVLPGHTNVSWLSFSTDLRLIATASFDQTARIWDARRGVELFALTGHVGQVTSVSFSPDGRQVLTTSGQAVKMWDSSNGKPLRQFDHGADVKTATFSPDRRLIAAAGEKGVTLWDAGSGTLLHRLEHPDWGIYGVAWTADSQRLATGGWLNTARLWDVASGHELREFKGHRGWIFSLAFSPDGKRLLTGGQDHTAKLWEVATGRELFTFSEHQDTVISVQFSTDGRRIVTCSDDQTIKIWQCASPEEVAAWEQEEKAASENLERLRQERERAKKQATSLQVNENP